MKTIKEWLTEEIKFETGLGFLAYLLLVLLVSKIIDILIKEQIQ